jgi:putative membrane protein
MVKRSPIQCGLLTLKGIAMGAADVVPGVSGGTIAFISGIYEELIDSINNINLAALKILKAEGFKAFWNYINGTFFVFLFTGIGFSIFSLAKVVSYLLGSQPVLIWSFFLWFNYRKCLANIEVN